ncbi:RING-H2 finger protein ATL5-like, partial [Selaginella moellendorffii]|uniref:RING-H2 finger protein ATL5-like n=1 Tax=Selaginella moellendorffii TaxID=88036 RepID=UPI000D1D081D
LDDDTKVKFYSEWKKSSKSGSPDLGKSPFLHGSRSSSRRRSQRWSPHFQQQQRYGNSSSEHHAGCGCSSHSPRHSLLAETSNSPPQDHQQDRDPEEQQQQPTLLIQTPALSKSLIQRLPVYKSSKSKRVSSDCAVCLGDFQEGEDVKILPKCGHGFHVECIDTWLSIHSNVCPLCRAQVEDPAAIVVSIDPAAAQVIEDGSSPPLEDHATIGSDRAGGVVTPGIRKKSSSLEEGSPLFRSIFARFSRAGAPPDDQNPSLPSSSSSPEDCRMRRSWSSSRVFSFRRNRQQQSDSLP